MRIRKKLYVHSILVTDVMVDKAQLYYMGRTAEDFAKSPEPNGVQRMTRDSSRNV